MRFFLLVAGTTLAGIAGIAVLAKLLGPRFVLEKAEWEASFSAHKPHLESEQSPQTSADLLCQLRGIDWFQFEQVVSVIHRRLGYMVERRGGANPDGGIDLVIEKDGRSTAVQCKHWKTRCLGVKTVREFLGALADAKMNQGRIIAFSGYTSEAKELASRHNIELLDEARLIQMLEAVNAKDDSEILALVRNQRKFCPKCENEMVLRTVKKGAKAGSKFWGCSAFPNCRYTLPVARSDGIG